MSLLFLIIVNVDPVSCKAYTSFYTFSVHELVNSTATTPSQSFEITLHSTFHIVEAIVKEGLISFYKVFFFLTTVDVSSDDVTDFVTGVPMSFLLSLLS